MLDAALVVGLVFIAVVVVLRLLAPSQDQKRAASQPGHWRTTHYDLEGETRVVLQKVSTSGALVDEHVIESIPVDDPEYDARFLTAMNAARERRALFESEDD